MNALPTIKRGDVFLADMGSVPSQKSSVQRGYRPVVIVSNNLNNKYSPTVNVVPLSAAHKKILPMHLYLTKDMGLERDSIALCEQTGVIDKSSLKEYVVTLSTEVMERLNGIICMQLQLD